MQRVQLNQSRALNGDFSFTLVLTNRSGARDCSGQKGSFAAVHARIVAFICHRSGRSRFRFLSERCAVRRIGCSVVLTWARLRSCTYPHNAWILFAAPLNASMIALNFTLVDVSSICTVILKNTAFFHLRWDRLVKLYEIDV